MNEIRFFILTFLAILSIPLSGQVIITEIMYDTPLNEKIIVYPYSDGEFIELSNLGISKVDLMGWKLYGGGSTEVFQFPENTFIEPNSFLIIAFKHKASTSSFESIYSTGGLEGLPIKVLYQNKIILSNSGESVVLKDESGFTRDSIFYDGESNKKKQDRLSADNDDSLAIINCKSVQRKGVYFDLDGRSITNNSDWVTTKVNPASHNDDFISFMEEHLSDYKISYVYNSSGNRISKTIEQIIEVQSMRNVRSNYEDRPLSDSIPNYDINIYPNPTSGLIFVDVSKNKENLPDEINGTLCVYNSNSIGGLLLKTKVDRNNNQVDLSNLPQGIYVVKIIINNEVSDWRIVKK